MARARKRKKPSLFQIETELFDVAALMEATKRIALDDDWPEEVGLLPLGQLHCAYVVAEAAREKVDGLWWSAISGGPR